jgi:hypothetical protein
VTKIRHGGYVFITWAGDHNPRHVHVYRDGRLVAKWDLENGRPIGVEVSGRLRRFISELVEEGRL